MSKVISFPKKPVETIELLDIIEDVYMVNLDGTRLVINLKTLKQILDGKISPSILDDDVLRYLLKGSMCDMLKQISEQIGEIF